MTKKIYMNVETGSVGTYEEWYYENIDGIKVNAVDLEEVKEVMMDDGGTWIEVHDV